MKGKEIVLVQLSAKEALCLTEEINKLGIGISKEDEKGPGGICPSLHYEYPFLDDLRQTILDAIKH